MKNLNFSMNSQLVNGCFWQQKKKKKKYGQFNNGEVF